MHTAIQPNYSEWGLSGKIKVLGGVTLDEVQPLLKKIISLGINLNNYQLAFANYVYFYQGEILPEVKCILLRFQRIDQKNNGYGGEHITVVYDHINHLLLGFTRMHANFNEEKYISHEKALQSGLHFLKNAAHDLLSENFTIPVLKQLNAGKRMVFEPTIPLGKLELHWIDKHEETMMANGKQIKITGMKIKTYIPSSALWAWIILNHKGEVETFERNVSWDFNKMQRKTQMWLHDNWLMQQHIVLDAV